MRRALRRIRGAIGVAVAQLRHDRLQTVLVVCGVALAVLATTMLASVGYGVVSTGEQKFTQSNRDLWVTGGPLAFSPGAVGGIENQIQDSHQVAARLQEHPDVKQATPLAFRTVYVSTGREMDSFDTIVGVGVPNAGSGTVSVERGRTFSKGDVHYAGGSYDGPMTNEIIVDERTADRYDVSVGDSLYVGGTIASARQHEFTVVGISPTFSQFLGTPTVTLHTSELQEVSGTTGTDPAALITVDLKRRVDAAAVGADLERQYPDLDVRTNREQFRSVLRGQALVIASGAILVVAAVVAGVALTLTVLSLLVYQQRRALAALKALGLSTRTLVTVAAGQGLSLGVAGGFLGIGLTYPLAWALNRLAVRVIGLEGLVQVPPLLVWLGLGIALGIGTLGAASAAWRVAQLRPLAQLDE